MSTMPYQPSEAPAVCQTTKTQNLREQLRSAEYDEASLLRHLHRTRDPKGLLMLRNLQGRIMDLKTQLRVAPRP